MSNVEFATFESPTGDFPVADMLDAAYWNQADAAVGEVNYRGAWSGC